MPTVRSAPVLAIIVVSYLMIVLDISIVITGLPKIQAAFDFTPTGLSWVHSAYTLAFGSLLLLGARAGDMLGRRRMYLIGLAIFTVASLVIGVAPSAALLIGARALQGVGAAILAPSTLALLTTSFPEGRERTRALSYYAAVAGIGGTVGLIVGGILADWLSWRVGFFLNVPIGIAMLLIAPRYLPETERRSGQLDLVGAVSSTLGMTALVYGIVRSASAGWSDPMTVASLGSGLVLLTVFVLVERRAPQPIMPLRLFAHRERAGAYAARLLVMSGLVGFWFFTTQFLQAVSGYSSLGAGLAFLPATIPTFLTALALPRLVQRFGSARVLAACLTSALVGIAWLSRATPDTSFLTGIALPMVLLGIGQGGAFGPLTASGVAGVDQEDAGAASGLVNVAHQLGASLGLSILVTAFAAAGGAALDGRAMLAHQISAAMTLGTAMLALALVVVLAVIVRPRRTAELVKARMPAERSLVSVASGRSS
jgi:EmrB/QacA subfamily drug resistance transporter